MNADQRADKLLSESRVHVLEADSIHIIAHVIGDEGVYRTTVWVDGRGLGKSCTCPNASFHPHSPRCSHTRALLRIFHPARLEP